MWAVFKRRVAEPLPWPRAPPRSSFRPLLENLLDGTVRGQDSSRSCRHTLRGGGCPQTHAPPAGSWGGNIPVPLRRFHITWVLFASHSDPKAQSGVFPVQRGDWGSD